MNSITLSEERDEETCYGYCNEYQPHAVRRISDDESHQLYDLRWDEAGNLGQVSMAKLGDMFEAGRFLFWTEDSRMHAAVDDSTCVYTVDTSAVLCIINDPAVEASVQGAKKHPALAAALSALLPGTGQMYASDFKKGWGLLALHCLVRPLVTWMPYMVSFEGIQFISKIIPRFIVGILDGVLVVYAIVNAIDLAKQANGTMTETCSRER